MGLGVTGGVEARGVGGGVSVAGVAGGVRIIGVASGVVGGESAVGVASGENVLTLVRVGVVGLMLAETAVSVSVVVKVGWVLLSGLRW